MAAEEVLKLFESHWFGLETTTTTPPNPFLEVEEQLKKPNLSHMPTLHIRSLSDHSLFSKTSSCSSDQYSFSPNSVLATTPRLQTIISGKVMKEEPPPVEVSGKNKVVNNNNYDPKPSPRRMGIRRKKKASKSLSELEFDELKGFMDLGFVFSEEDKDSSLVSIIPGLQRFGSREEVVVDVVGDDDHVGVSRPYLSEAWEVLEQRKKEKALRKNLRIPALGTNEMDMKDHLKFWAYTVASTVR